MVIADGLKTLFQMDQFNSRPKLQADLVTSQYGIWGVSDGGAHTKFVTHGPSRPRASSTSSAPGSW